MYSLTEGNGYGEIVFDEDVEKIGQTTESPAAPEPSSTTKTAERLPEREKGENIPWFIIVLIALVTFLCGMMFDVRSTGYKEGQLNSWSTVAEYMDKRYHNVVFDGSFLDENIFRKPASPEVDIAWESLGINYRSLRVSDEDAKYLHWPSYHVRISDQHGGGCPANVEGLHHLHCLNLLRQALYYNYDYYHAQGEGAFKNEDHIVQRHVSHCLDILRQQLVCMPDTGVLGQIWWDPQDPKPFVDFNTHHRCKNFTSIRMWAEQEQLPEDLPEDFLEPPREGMTVSQYIP